MVIMDVNTAVLALILIIACAVDYFTPGDVEAKKWIVLGTLFLSGTYTLWRVS